MKGLKVISILLVLLLAMLPIMAIATEADIPHDNRQTLLDGIMRPHVHGERCSPGCMLEEDFFWIGEDGRYFDGFMMNDELDRQAEDPMHTSWILDIMFPPQHTGYVELCNTVYYVVDVVQRYPCFTPQVYAFDASGTPVCLESLPAEIRASLESEKSALANHATESSAIQSLCPCTITHRVTLRDITETTDSNCWVRTEHFLMFCEMHCRQLVEEVIRMTFGPLHSWETNPQGYTVCRTCLFIRDLTEGRFRRQSDGSFIPSPNRP